MAARNPTDFTRYVNDNKVGPRLPVIRSQLDEIINDQQFAVDCEQLVLSATLRCIPGGGGVKVGEIFPNLLGKQFGDGATASFSAYILGCIEILDNADIWWVGTRPNHSAAWTYSSLAMPAPAAWAWYYFGALVSIPIGGDLFVGYESPAAGAFPTLNCVGVYAIET